MKKVNISELVLEDAHGGELKKKVLVAKKDIDNKHLMFVNEAYIDTGKEMSSHLHDDMEEVFYFLSGEGEMSVGEETTKIKAGDRIIAPAKQSQWIKNTGKTTLKYICLGIKL